jgi:hypothetical protein
MAGLDPAIHVIRWVKPGEASRIIAKKITLKELRQSLACQIRLRSFAAWMAGSSPAMTASVTVHAQSLSKAQFTRISILP